MNEVINDSGHPGCYLPDNLPDRRANYFVLESETSGTADEDTESVGSLQSRETDFVRNTTDTDTKSEYDIEIEYEVASSQEGGSGDHRILSSSNEEDIIVMAAVSAAINNKQRKGPTEDDDDTPLQTIFTWCSECHKHNDNPQYRCCSKCFKRKKSIFPPRPRKTKRNSSKLEIIKPGMSGISSQDSGLGGCSQDSSVDSRTTVQKEKKRKYSSSLDEDEPRSSLSQSDDDQSKGKEETPEDPKERLSLPGDNAAAKKRKAGSGSNSDSESPRKKSRSSPVFKQPEPFASKSDPQLGCILPVPVKASTSGLSSSSKSGTQKNSSKVCIVCNSAETNGAFVHGMSAHLCCCYSCAIKIYKTTKRCPACNRKILSVHKVFKA